MMKGITNVEGVLVMAIVVVITPGIDKIMVLTRGISIGKTAGLYSALSVSLGQIFHTCAVTFGLSLIIAKSAIAFGIIKYLGAAYLIYIGLKSLLNKNDQTEIKATEIKITGNEKNDFDCLFE